jgi:hypothetical protein
MGSEVVRIYIGVDKVEFTVHKQLLLASGSIFSDMFPADRKPTERVTLGMEEPEVFKLFIEYLYTKAMPRAHAAAPAAANAQRFRDLCQLYAFTDKFQLDVHVCNRAMDAVQDAFLAAGLLPDPPLVDAVYELTPVGSKLREFCAAGLLFAVRTGDAREDDALMEFLGENREALRDFVRAVRYVDGVERDPRIRDCQGEVGCVECLGDAERLAGKHGVWPCQYHIHPLPKVKQEDASEDGKGVAEGVDSEFCHLWSI